MGILNTISKGAELERNKLYIKDRFQKQEYDIILGIVEQISEEVQTLLYKSHNRMIQLEQENQVLREEIEHLQKTYNDV